MGRYRLFDNTIEMFPVKTLEKSAIVKFSPNISSFSRSQAVSKVAEIFFPTIGRTTNNFGRDETGVLTTLISTGAVRYVSRRKDDYHKYDLSNLRTWGTSKLLMFLAEYFPEMSKAVDTYLKVSDTSFIFNTFKPDHSPSTNSQELIKGNIQRINNYGLNLKGYNIYSGFRSFLREQFFNVLLGAACCESVYEEKQISKGNLVNYDVKKLIHQYFESVNPLTIKFSYDGIPYQSTPTYGVDVELNIPNFFYEKNTFFVGYPYGRNQIVSIIRPALFKLELMEDLKGAVHKQGHPRIKVELDDKTILAEAERISPEDVRTSEQKVAFIQDVLDAIATNASNLKADSCITHLASQKWTYLEMQHTGQGMFNPEKLIESIDTQITCALQTFPTILGKSFAGNTEGYSSIESLLYLIWISGNQKIICDMMNQAFTQILHKEHSKQGYVVTSFKQPKLRQNEEMEGFKANALNNIRTAFISGSINYDEMTRRVRECLDFDGDRPDDAEFFIDVFMKLKDASSPSRDPSQEPQKEQNRKDTNEKKKQTD